MASHKLIYPSSRSNCWCWTHVGVCQLVRRSTTLTAPSQQRLPSPLQRATRQRGEVAGGMGHCRRQDAAMPSLRVWVLEQGGSGDRWQGFSAAASQTQIRQQWKESTPGPSDDDCDAHARGKRSSGWNHIRGVARFGLRNCSRSLSLQ